MATELKLYEDGVLIFHRAGTVVPPGGGDGGGPVDPPPGGGGGGTPPPGYTGPLVFDMGLPGEKSPTDLQRQLSAGSTYSLRFTKTSEGNTMRLMGAPQWFSGVTYRFEGRPDLGERKSGSNGGLSDLNHSGTALGEVVIHFILDGPAGPGTGGSGNVAPQLF